MKVVIFVNADGSTERRPLAALLYRVADFDRGKAWAQMASAINEKTSIPVYVEIPWSSYSEREPKAQKEYEEECMRQGGDGRQALR